MPAQEKLAIEYLETEFVFLLCHLFHGEKNYPFVDPAIALCSQFGSMCFFFLLICLAIVYQTKKCNIFSSYILYCFSMFSMDTERDIGLI